MKTLVIFYSYSGSTKTAAQQVAAKESAEILEIKDLKRPWKIRAFTAGIFASLQGKAWGIEPLGVNTADYDRIILLTPIWADNPPPAVNALLAQLPSGKAVAVKTVSLSGKSGCKERIEAILKEKGCSLESFEDIKA